MSTFSQQGLLPSLPVPDLDAALDKYLQSVEVFLSDEEKKSTREHVDKYRRSNLAKQIHNALINRAISSRNWLEQWWYDAYNEIRSPLAPFLSLASVNQRFAPAEGTQLCRAAEFLHHAVRYWLSIRREQIPITKSRGTVWDMHQYYNMFNAARIPARPKDVIRRFFCTEKEGASSSEVLVLCRGNIWIIETMPNNEVLSPDIFLHQLTFIDHQSKRCRSSPIPLTTLQRDKWADMRLRLISLSESNAVNLARIEQTMFVISLTEETFNSADDVISYGLVGCADAQWVDKSMNFFFHKDGRMGTQAEHSNVDAIVILDASDLSSKVSRKDIWQPEEADYAKPTKLEFAMDNSLAAAVDEAERAFAQLRTTLAGMSVSFELFGNERFKASKVYGDTIIQMALQLAFYRTHGKLAPAYETASTRQFFHGRTETVRSCTAPLAKLVRLIVDDHAEKDVLRSAFVEAYETHNRLMNEAMEGKGCDRYLYGVCKTIELFNMSSCMKVARPEMFSDPAWRISGGDGNFALSTSFVGYDIDGSYGYVSPMCEDGYGAFYKIGPNRVLVALSVFTTSKLTDLRQMGNNIKWSLEYLSQFFPISSRV